MKILVACEESQRVANAFRERGHEAYSCDLIECSGGHKDWHIVQDVIPILNGDCTFFTQDGKLHEICGRWDMIIAHPPCTYMSKAGARWMFPVAGKLDKERFSLAMEAKAFFMSCYNADCEKVVVENPTPLKIIGLPKESQIIQPYEYGDPYSKRTLLWIKGVPNLVPTSILSEYTPWMPSNTGGYSRGKGGSRGHAHDPLVASKTFPGIARAMAEQWG